MYYQESRDAEDVSLIGEFDGYEPEPAEVEDLPPFPDPEDEKTYPPEDADEATPVIEGRLFL